MAFQDVFGGLFGAGLNYFGDQGTRLADKNIELVNQFEDKRKNAYNTYSGQLAGLLPGLEEAYVPRGGNVTGGLATGTYDPTSGTTKFDLDPRVKSLMDQYLAGASKQMGLAGDTDPQRIGADRVAKAQALMAPGREAQQNKLMRDLQSRGLLGVASHDGSPTGNAQNPYMAAMAGAQKQADERLAVDSLQMGEEYLDRLMSRSGGMLGNAMGINDMGLKYAGAATNLGNMLTQQKREAGNMKAGLLSDVYKQQMLANSPSEKLYAAQLSQAAAEAARKQGLINGLIPAGTSLATQLLQRLLGGNGSNGGGSGILNQLLSGVRGIGSIFGSGNTPSSLSPEDLSTIYGSAMPMMPGDAWNESVNASEFGASPVEFVNGVPFPAFGYDTIMNPDASVFDNFYVPSDMGNFMTPSQDFGASIWETGGYGDYGPPVDFDY